MYFFIFLFQFLSLTNLFIPISFSDQLLYPLSLSLSLSLSRFLSFTPPIRHSLSSFTIFLLPLFLSPPLLPSPTSYSLSLLFSFSQHPPHPNSSTLSFSHLLLSSAIGSDKKCNGVPGLCDLSLNDVTLPATHNSGAYNLDHGNLNDYQPLKKIREELATSQSLTFREQLEAGVRAVDIEPCCAHDETLNTVSHS